MNVTLIGMSGAGKSYVGKKVAERLKLSFIDIDAEIERAHGKILSGIIQEVGDREFIRIESAMTIALAQGERSLISTGGSIVYSSEAVAHLKQVSRIIYLNVPFDMIARRVRADADRQGRIIGLGSRTLRDVYDERMPLYERCADISVDVGSLGIEDAVGAVLRAIDSPE